MLKTQIAKQQHVQINSYLGSRKTDFEQTEQLSQLLKQENK